MLCACLKWDFIMKSPATSIFIILYGRGFARVIYFMLGLFWFAVGISPLLYVIIDGFPHI
ncbi:hypothetical protein V144x_10910 [Gimesia aquarii]|uniref:Uncharacterized protein n=1 Tax=Gimesia aquarii TaxID=2527964 RepID=A0A517VRJ1_9PLAN|nr:hypothetical protein V144x_10910 [Gimesia aquarii]